MLKILDLYILKRILITYVFMVTTLCGIVIMITFSERLDDLIEKNIPLHRALLEYYPYMFVHFANLMSPICIFLSVILFTSRLAQNTEIIAILSSGVGFYRLMRPYLLTAIVLMISSFFLNAYFVPISVRKYSQFEYENIRQKRLFTGRNIHKKVDKDVFAYIYAFNQFDLTADRFILEEVKDGRLARRIEAGQAVYVDSTKQWQMKDVVTRIYNGEEEHMTRRATLDTTLKFQPTDIYRTDHFRESLTLNQLNDYIALERDRGSDALTDLLLESYQRYAFPCASLILTFIGVALASRKRRGGIAVQLGVGFALSFIYIFVLITARVVLNDLLPSWLAVWLPNILFGVLALILIRSAPK